MSHTYTNGWPLLFTSKPYKIAFPVSTEASVSFCYKRLKLQTSHFFFKLYISNSISDLFFFPSWSECRLVEETSPLNTESMDPKDGACNPNKNTNTVLRKGWGEGCGLSRKNFLQNEEWQSLETKRYAGKDSGVRLCHALWHDLEEQLLPACQILWRKTPVSLRATKFW